MSTFASKNLYELLGNDADQDPDREVPPPVQPIDKPAARIGKRNAPAEAPVKETPAEPTRGGRGGRGRGRGRGDFGGNEQAFRDRDAGRESNRGKPTDEVAREDRPRRYSGDRPSRGYGYEGRGGRGYRGGGRGGRGPRDDRHSRGFTTDPNDGAKQAGHSWGEQTGPAEWNDEQAGEAIAKAEQKEAIAEGGPEEPVNADGEHPVASNETAVAEEAQPEPEPEPEDKTKSYAAYLAEQAEKKLALGNTLTVRKANEGSSDKFEGKAIARDEAEDAYMSGTTKTRRERERKEKNVFVLEHDIQQRESTGFRGGRGGRGRGRGEEGFRGGRGGRGRGRGEFRGESRGEHRGDYRGGIASKGGSSPNVTNEADFPSLGK